MQSQRIALAAGTILAVALAIFLVANNPRDASEVLGADGEFEPAPETDSLLVSGSAGSDRIRFQGDLAGLDSAAGTSGNSDRPMAEVSITVVDANGNHIEGAEFHNTDRGSHLGASDLNGELSVQVALGSEFDLLVSHGEFVSRFAHVKAELGEAILLQMMPAWKMKGIVLDPSGSPIGSGVRILAVDPFQFLRTDAVAATFTGIPSIQSASTDSDGRFELHGLNHEMSYQLFVGGRGCVSFKAIGERRRFSSKSTQPISIATQAAYAVRVMLTDEAGGPLKLGEEFFGPWMGSPRPTSGGTYGVPLTANLGILLGLDNAETKGPHESVLVFGSYSELDYLELDYRVDVPGYVPISGTMRCPRAQGELATVVLELEGSELRRGSIQVSCSSGQSLDELLGPERLQLILENQSTGSLIACDLVEIANDGSYVVSGVPFGTYSVRVEHPLQSYAFQLAGSIQVSEEPAVVGLPAVHRGALEIEVQTGSGASFSGPIRGSLTSLGDGETFFFNFAHAPYHIPLLQAGQWDLSIQTHQPVVFPGVGGKYRFEVDQNTVALAEIVIQ